MTHRVVAVLTTWKLAKAGHRDIRRTRHDLRCVRLKPQCQQQQQQQQQQQHLLHVVFVMDDPVFNNGYAQYGAVANAKVKAT